jgi:hypothetical protein
MTHWLSVVGKGRAALGTILFLLFVAVPTSRGSVILFSNKATWLAATAVSGTIDFEGIAPAGGTSDFSTAAGLTLGGVTFLGQIQSLDCSINGCTPFSSGHQLFVSAPGGFDGLDWGSGGFLVGPQSFFSVVSPGFGTAQDGTLTVQFPSGTNAIAFDLMSLGSIGSTPTIPHICLSTGDCFDIATPTYPGHKFVGFTSSVPLDSAVLTIPEGIPTTSEIFLDNVERGTSIPEPGGLSVLGLALLVLWGQCTRHFVGPYKKCMVRR